MIKSRTEKVFKCIFAILGFFYVLAVIKTTFLRDGIRLETNIYHLIPFGEIQDYRDGVKSLNSLLMNYLGNIAMFFPLGIFLPIFFKKLNFGKVVLSGLLISVIIEVSQYFLSSGYADTDDVIMNTLGAALGAITFFYILKGKKRHFKAYLLSLLLILAIEFGAVFGAWYLAPNLLPDRMVVINDMIAGRSLYDFDVRVKCYKFSHGDAFAIDGTAQDYSGNRLTTEKSYRFSDTTIYVTETVKNGKKTYHIAGIDDMIDAVQKEQSAYVKLWFDDGGRCRIVMLEKTE